MNYSTLLLDFFTSFAMTMVSNSALNHIVIPWRIGPHKNKVFVGDADRGALVK